MTGYSEDLEVAAGQYEDTSSYSLHVCDDCGAAVRDCAVHSGWHHGRAAAAPLPPARPKPATRVEVLDVELEPLIVSSHPDYNAVILSQEGANWSTLLDDPAQVRLLADTLTAHADRMENR